MTDYTPEGRATEIVVAEDFTYTDRSFQYAAAFRTVKIAAGRYPLEYVTIRYTKPYAPVHHDGGPYYVTAELPCETIEARHTLETDTHPFRTYQYIAIPGETALGIFEGSTYIPKAVFA